MKCINPECDSDDVRCKGMCNNCYKRYMRKGTYKRDRIIGTTVCGNPKCGKTFNNDGWRKGYCTTCYSRLKKNGSLEYKQIQIRGNTQCIDCGSYDNGGKNWLKQRCRKCYDNYRRRLANKPTRMRGIISCIQCNSDNLGRGFRKGLCNSCYEKQSYIVDRYKKYREKNIVRRRIHRNNYVKNKFKNDPIYRLHCKISVKIRKNLRKFNLDKKNKTVEYLGCTIEEFKQHLESQFDKNMTWDNYGKYWHIDHIIPINSFNFDKEESLYKCWNYRNLRPLKSGENVVKSDLLPNGKKARNMIYKIGSSLFDKIIGDL